MALIQAVIFLVFVGFLLRAPQLDLRTITLTLSLMVGVMAAAQWVMGRVARFLGREGAWRRDTRRRHFHVSGDESARERELEALDDDALEVFCRKQPRHALAHEILAERMLKAGRPLEYTRLMTYMLGLPNQLSIAQRCMVYHRLADVYLEAGRPGQAVETLRNITDDSRMKTEAVLARQRIREINERGLATEKA